MVSQFIHGTRYIDELVLTRVAAKGDLYVHQDANWNVIGTTDLGRHVVERSIYTPYGELTVHQDTGFGDRDGDADVDSTDKGTVGVTCTGTVSGTCRILDLDFDGDYDSTDAGFFDSLTQGAQRHPGRPATAVTQPFAHQGLLFEPELAQYQNRARQYDPEKRRFAQPDAAGYVDGMGRYAYVHSSPVLWADPTGRIASGVDWKALSHWNSTPCGQWRQIANDANPTEHEIYPIIDGPSDASCRPHTGCTLSKATRPESSSRSMIVGDVQPPPCTCATQGILSYPYTIAYVHVTIIVDRQYCSYRGTTPEGIDCAVFDMTHVLATTYKYDNYIFSGTTTLSCACSCDACGGPCF